MSAAGSPNGVAVSAQRQKGKDEVGLKRPGTPMIGAPGLVFSRGCSVSPAVFDPTDELLLWGTEFRTHGSPEEPMTMRDEKTSSFTSI